jgi:hypothetical protein
VARERRRDAGGEASAAAGGGAWPGKTQLRVPSLGLECGWYGGIEGDTGNRSRAVGGDQIGCGGGVTASDGSGTPTSSCDHGEVAGEGKEGPMRVLTTTWCSGGGRSIASGSRVAARRRPEAATAAECFGLGYAAEAACDRSCICKLDIFC